MIGLVDRRAGILLLTGPLFATLQVSDAQQPRARTLTYEPDRKEWIELSAPSPGTPEGDLHAIKVQIREAKYRQALSAAKKSIKRHGEADPLYAQVLLAKAEALIGGRKHHKAHIALQEFLGRFAGTALASEALRLEFVIAETFLAGVKRKVWGVPLLSGEDLAYRILDEISTGYPESRLAELSIKAKADHLFKVGEHALAELEYGRILRDHPRSRYTQFALHRSATAALGGFAGVEYDDAQLIEAEEGYHHYRLRYPAAADREGVGLILDSVREARAEKDLSVAAYYERTNHLGSAIFYYKLVREDWPDTIAATKAASRLGLLGALEPVTSTDVSPRELPLPGANETSEP